MSIFNSCDCCGNTNKDQWFSVFDGNRSYQICPRCYQKYVQVLRGNMNSSAVITSDTKKPLADYIRTKEGTDSNFNTDDEIITSSDAANQEIDTIDNSVSSSSTNEENKVAVTIKIVGILYMIICLTGSILFLSSNLALGLAGIFLGVLSGVLLLGFAEIIKLLQDIKNK